jgi:hypothetical protein
LTAYIAVKSAHTPLAELECRFGSADHTGMTVPSPIVRTRPDRLTLWPTEDASYGLEVRWGGPTGAGQATTVRDAAHSSGLPVKMRQDLDGSGWIVTVGPLPREHAVRVIETFLI